MAWNEPNEELREVPRTTAATSLRRPSIHAFSHVTAAAMRRGLTTASRAARRLLSTSPPTASHIGVLHVYKLEPATPTPGQRLQLLFSADGGAPSAEQLADAAARGEAVLVPASSLSGIIGDKSRQLSAGDENKSAALLADGSASADSLVASAASTDGLALAEAAAPLADLLSAHGDADPDWSSTAELPSSTIPTPTAEQQAVLLSAARGDVSALAAALDACPAAELAAAAQQPSGGGPLHLAATSGATDAVKLLLTRTPLAVHDTAANGSTPLHWAAGSGHVDVVKLLLNAGSATRTRSSTWRSTVRGNDSGQTPAHWAAASGHTQALEALLSHDPHALLMEDERQLQPAAVAARDGHPWLQEALGKLEREPVVCVRVRREATMRKVLDGSVDAGSGGADVGESLAIER